MKDFNRADYLEDPMYDLGCKWVVKNVHLVRILISHHKHIASNGAPANAKVGEDGIVDYGSEGYENKYRLEVIRQIGVRQDGSYYGTAGPIVGFIDLALIERPLKTNHHHAIDRDRWAAAVFVRPKIIHIGRLLREIEFCRHGCIKDERVNITVGGGNFIHGNDMPFVIVTNGEEHREAITAQGYKLLSSLEAFKPD